MSTLPDIIDLRGANRAEQARANALAMSPEKLLLKKRFYPAVSDKEREQFINEARAVASTNGGTCDIVVVNFSSISAYNDKKTS